MSHEWVEIPVAVQQAVVIFYAAGGDHRVYCFAGRDAERAQCTKISGGLNRYGLSAEVDYDQRSQKFSCLVEIAVCPEALQYLSQNKIAGGDRLAAEQCIERVGLKSQGAPEIIDPYA